MNKALINTPFLDDLIYKVCSYRLLMIGLSNIFHLTLDAVGDTARDSFLARSESYSVNDRLKPFKKKDVQTKRSSIARIVSCAVDVMLIWLIPSVRHR